MLLPSASSRLSSLYIPHSPSYQLLPPKPPPPPSLIYHTPPVVGSACRPHVAGERVKLGHPLEDGLVVHHHEACEPVDGGGVGFHAVGVVEGVPEVLGAGAVDVATAEGVVAVPLLGGVRGGRATIEERRGRCRGCGGGGGWTPASDGSGSCHRRARWVRSGGSGSARTLLSPKTDQDRKNTS